MAAAWLTANCTLVVISGWPDCVDTPGALAHADGATDQLRDDTSHVGVVCGQLEQPRLRTQARCWGTEYVTAVALAGCLGRWGHELPRRPGFTFPPLGKDAETGAKGWASALAPTATSAILGRGLASKVVEPTNEWWVKPSGRVVPVDERRRHVKNVVPHRAPVRHRVSRSADRTVGVVRKA